MYSGRMGKQLKQKLYISKVVQLFSSQIFLLRSHFDFEIFDAQDFIEFI